MYSRFEFQGKNGDIAYVRHARSDTCVGISSLAWHEARHHARAHACPWVCVHGRLREYEVLVTLEFTSARKRSSVVVMKRRPDGSEVVFTAGCGLLASMIGCSLQR